MRFIAQRPGNRLLSLSTLVLVFGAIPLVAKAEQATCSPEGVQQGSGWTLLDKSPSNYVCVKPHVDWTQYKQYELEPSVYTPLNSKEELKKQDAQKLTAYFDSKLQASYKGLPNTGGTTLKIKPVIVGVKRSRPALNVIGFLVVPVPISYGGAAVRYNLIDGNTGEIIGVVTGTRGGRPWNGFQSLSTLGHSRVVLNGDAKRLRKTTDGLVKSSPQLQTSVSSTMQ
jgi:uncharacterized protein DUF3313